jgi:hypothetical protein
MNRSITETQTVRTQVREAGLATNHSQAVTTVRTRVAARALTSNHSQAVARLG